MAYIDWTYYSVTYGGSAIAQAEFTALAINASAFVDLVTMDRAAAYMALLDPTPEEADIVSKIKNATCAVADQLHTYSADGGIISNESVGSHSVTYADREKQTLTKKLSAAAYPFLAHTGLMYRGFNADEYTSYPIFS